MTSVNLVAFENGVGNSRDLAIMRRVLESLGCNVSVTTVSPQVRRRRRSSFIGTIFNVRRWCGRGRTSSPGRFDLNVMMEHIWPEQLSSARQNIVVPNPEWFDRADQRLLSHMDRVWSKTAHSFEVFSKLGCRTEIIGFDSEDRYDPTVPRQPSFFHLAGKSRMKGTGRLAQLWSLHPEWPMLTILHSRKAAFKLVAAPNIHYETRYLADADLRELQNRHQFHLCLSETEGWGHYIPEAMSVAAVVIATDAPPMQEMVSRSRGLLVSASPLSRQHLAVTYAFDDGSLERSVESSLAMSASERARLGDQSREWFIENKRGFMLRVGCALEHLLSGST